MFGQYYAEYDRALAGLSERGPSSVGEYAAVVLADLLERAVLRDIVEHVEMEAVTPLYRTVTLFLQDAEEAQARGLRARLFARTSGELDPWSIDPADTLDDIGGPLIPNGHTQP